MSLVSAKSVIRRLDIYCPHYLINLILIVNLEEMQMNKWIDNDLAKQTKGGFFNEFTGQLFRRVCSKFVTQFAVQIVAQTLNVSFTR